MKQLLLILFMSVVAIPVFAQKEVDLPKVKGIVRQVDKVNAKIKIKHEEIPNLNMPPMTMTFEAAAPEMLEGLVNGDKILFISDEIDGKLTVLWIEKQQPKEESHD
jgi:Cu(I)/Ag(I) efflux system periplasmic protein CusF